MSNDFNWQTEDKADWEEELRPEPKASRNINLISWFKRRWRWLSLIAAIFLVISLIIYSLLNRQIEQSQDTTTADVLAAHNLDLQSAFYQDYELMEAVKVDKYRRWKTLQH
jgi:hypothetical protein